MACACACLCTIVKSVGCIGWLGGRQGRSPSPMAIRATRPRVLTAASIATNTGAARANGRPRSRYAPTPKRTGPARAAGIEPSNSSLYEPSQRPSYAQVVRVPPRARGTATAAAAGALPQCANGRLARGLLRTCAGQLKGTGQRIPLGQIVHSCASASAARASWSSSSSMAHRRVARRASSRVMLTTHVRKNAGGGTEAEKREASFRRRRARTCAGGSCPPHRRSRSPMQACCGAVVSSLCTASSGNSFHATPLAGRLVSISTSSVTVGTGRMPAASSTLSSRSSKAALVLCTHTDAHQYRRAPSRIAASPASPPTPSPSSDRPPPAKKEGSKEGQWVRISARSSSGLVARDLTARASPAAPSPLSPGLPMGSLSRRNATRASLPPPGAASCISWSSATVRGKGRPLPLGCTGRVGVGGSFSSKRRPGCIT